MKRNLILLALCFVIGSIYVVVSDALERSRNDKAWHAVYDNDYMLVNNSCTAVKLHPQDACDYSWRAEALSADGKFEEALSNINQTIRLRPGDESSYVSKANILAKLGRNKEAVETLKFITEPDYWGWNHTYKTRLAIQDWHGAIAELEQLIIAGA